MTDEGKNHLILLGAGFSRNWGGWLAAEADEYLLGHPQVDKSVRDILWQYRNRGGFEAALGHLQNEKSDDQRLIALQAALRQMFIDMDNGFRGTIFNFNNELKTSVAGFLTRFDAIFTLNQDLLLERHYLNDNVCLMSNGRWNGYHVPGLRRTNGPQLSPYDIESWEPDEANFTLQKHAQPYFKLHGSSNWQSAKSTELLVMGGNKSGLIEKFGLLKWYHEEFKRRLSQSNTKLMVIGYGFGDHHINQIIQKAVKETELKLFIVDPLGASVIDKNRNAQVYSPDVLLTCH